MFLHGIFGADLVDMQSLSESNNNFRYILMVIDIFSKYGYAEAISRKTGKAVKDALEKIFKKQKPEKLWADRGSEFYNKDVKFH